MSDTETEQAPCYISMRVPAELHRAVAHDAEALGISISDAARIRLRTGRVPTLNEKDEDHGR